MFFFTPIIVAGLSLAIIIGIQASPEYFINDVYLEEVNPEYLDPNNTSFELDWINSTFAGMSSNFTVTKTVPPETTLHLNIYEESMAEDKKPNLISISMEYCRGLKSPVLASSKPSAGNMTTAACPLVPGTYFFEKWHPLIVLLVALDPSKRYRTSCRIEYNGTVVVRLSVTYSIQ